MLSLKISELDSTDAEHLLPLLYQVQNLHIAAHPDIFRHETPSSELVEFLEKWLANENVSALVARTDDGAIIGYLIYELQHRGVSALKHSGQIGFLHKVSVDEAYRGQRVGSRLVEELKLRLRRIGITQMGSEYFAFNKASAALMRSVGLAPLRVTVVGKIGDDRC